MPDFEMIGQDLKLSWTSAVRALNAAQNTGATDTASQIKEIVIGLSIVREFCESMASLGKENQCPCVIADEPCHEFCTCVNPHSYRGCMCCARYGSDDQRRESANRITATIVGSEVNKEVKL